MKEIIGVLGAGAMGSGIAQVAAQAGHKVIIFDSYSGSVEKSKKLLDNNLSKLQEKGKISSEKAAEIKQAISYAQYLEDFAPAALVIEAVIEDLVVKQELFSQLEDIVGPTCILASNTSSLSITSIASACQQAERCMGIHFFNPAPLMPLVEIIPGLQSREDYVAHARKLVDSWGKITVIAKDTPGFIVNRVARPFYGEALRIYEEGIADMATIDWVMKALGGFKMGPFELMDFIGNDVNYKVTESVWEQSFYEDRYKPSFTQKRLFEAKRYGRKSGRGYYDYNTEAVAPLPDKDEKKGALILNRILCMLFNEAMEALHLQIATKVDLDLAMTKGVNYPKGLLQWAEEFGLENVLQQLDVLYNDYREDRYRASVLLRRTVKDMQQAV